MLPAFWVGGPLSIMAFLFMWWGISHFNPESLSELILFDLYRLPILMAICSFLIATGIFGLLSFKLLKKGKNSLLISLINSILMNLIIWAVFLASSAIIGYSLFSLALIPVLWMATINSILLTFTFGLLMVWLTKKSMHKSE